MRSAESKKRRPAKSKTRKQPYRPRDPEATKERILQTAIKEFSINGYNGARVGNIAKKAKTNMRMLYHYFTDKEQLYIATLEQVYRDVRMAEQDLHFEDEDPRVGLEKLVNFTFEHFASHPDLVNIVMNENMLRARYLTKSDLVPSMSAKLSASVATLLKNGVERGAFVRRPDPSQLWLTIFSLCWVHLANRHTMSWTLRLDLGDPKWLEVRRKHVVEVVSSYMCGPLESAKH